MSVEFRSIQNSINEDVCMICMEEMNEGLVSHDTDQKVQHAFHKNCLTGWLKVHASCPLCRSNVSNINGPVLAIPVRGSDVIRAAMQGNHEGVRELLSRGVISERDRGIALIGAAEAGFTETVMVLMQNGLISADSIERAFLNAVRGGYVDIIRILLDTDSISTAMRGRAVLAATAAEEPSFEIVSLILEKGPILEEHCSNAILEAIYAGSKKIAYLLLEKGDLSIEKRNEMNLLLKGERMRQAVHIFSMVTLLASSIAFGISKLH